MSAGCLLAGAGARGQQQPKSLFYMTREPGSVRSFLAHADKIDVLSPGWYAVDANGLVTGGPNPMVMETARQHHVAVMPLVVNAGFVPEDMHKLLVDKAAHAQTFAWLVQACKENGYIGMQLVSRACRGRIAMRYPRWFAKPGRRSTRKDCS